MHKQAYYLDWNILKFWKILELLVMHMIKAQQKKIKELKTVE